MTDIDDPNHPSRSNQKRLAVMRGEPMPGIETDRKPWTKEIGALGLVRSIRDFYIAGHGGHGGHMFYHSEEECLVFVQQELERRVEAVRLPPVDFESPSRSGWNAALDAVKGTNK